MEKTVLSSYVITFALVFGLVITFFEIFILKKINNQSLTVVTVILFIFLNGLFIWLIYLFFAGVYTYAGAIILLLIIVLLLFVKLIFISFFPINGFLKFFLSVVSVFLVAGFAFTFYRFIILITPTPEVMATSVRNNNLIYLRLQMWMGGGYQFLKLPVEATQNRNMEALKIIFQEARDPDVLLHTLSAIDNQQERKIHWEVTKLMIEYGRRDNRSRKYCFYYALDYSIEELKYCINHHFKVKDYPDAIIEAIQRTHLSDDSISKKEKTLIVKQKINILLYNGADINSCMSNEIIGSNVNELPLFCAIKEDYSEIAEFLISKGANVDLPNLCAPGWFDPAGTTPLILATKKERINCIKLLLVNGADRNKKDEEGKSAIDYADKDELKRLLNTDKSLL